MKKSIRKQIATIFIALVGCVLLVSILINTWFLENFYVCNKQTTLISVYNTLDTASTAGELTTERFVDRLNELVEVGNVSLVVVNDDNKSFLTATTNEVRTREMVTQLMGYLVNQNQGRGKLLKSTSNYEIRSAEDVVGGGEYIEMWGYLSTGNAFILRSPLESIRESATDIADFFGKLKDSIPEIKVFEVVEGKVYEICYRKCLCDLYTKGLLKNGVLCECSRRSLLYNLLLETLQFYLNQVLLLETFLLHLHHHCLL